MALFEDMVRHKMKMEEKDCPTCAALRARVEKLEKDREGECMHCGEAITNADIDHWRTCAEHPAAKELAALRAEVAEIRQGNTNMFIQNTRRLEQQSAVNHALRAEVERLKQELTLAVRMYGDAKERIEKLVEQNLDMKREIGYRINDNVPF